MILILVFLPKGLKGLIMKFKIEIDLDNDAFQENSNLELARILGEIIFNLKKYNYTTVIKDLNGNTVGNAVLAEK